MNEYSPAKTGEHLKDIFQFSERRVLGKFLKENKTKSPIWRENMLGYLSVEVLSVPRTSQFARASLVGTDYV